MFAMHQDVYAISNEAVRQNHTNYLWTFPGSYFTERLQVDDERVSRMHGKQIGNAYCVDIFPVT